ncbi:MocR-like pyridoxine biosynthesis transcription factor PdxR [Actinomadura parmotrematis]|uniref:PLP-dependent aminotransferase family protein n=1 Tax=Actinomadura parmotrematis TaxID=2864039 RepID=A0ABS7G128_9ACTN|nr:PLP-dependent aminotransferase family protein [Actinomadura parmotrematis]MBW8486419.1 PLP-dependent aminotransferase family protein [Actinomadura parmotrematis]
MFDLPVVVERSSGVPLRDQLAGQLRDAMRDGRLAAGERLPSSRGLAAALAVSRTVVSEAYEQLYAEGWLEGRHGSGTFVTDIAAPLAAPDAAGPDPAPFGRAAPPGAIDLRPGVAWTGSLRTPAWRRAWRQAADVPLGPRGDPRGLPGLRAALADLVRRARGVACPVERVLVTRGTTNGLDMLAAALLRPGDRVGVEEPGYAKATQIMRARGLEAVPCPVDEHGLVVDGLPGDLRLVYTTPSHQYPLGGVLPVPRRQALLAWARRTGALVAEDDYDGEFRFDVAPLPALYGLDPDRVAYLGTASKTLSSDVGVGWLVARPGVVAAVARHRDLIGDRTPLVPQEAMRLLIERGDLDRHVRRMRGVYARRRAAVAAALDGLPLRGDTAGLHLVVELPAGHAARVAERAAARGVLVDTLDRLYAGPVAVSGLVVGYGAAAGLGDLRTGCSLVRELAREAAAPPAARPAARPPRARP